MKRAVTLIFMLAAGTMSSACPVSLEQSGTITLTRTDPYFSVVMENSRQGLKESRVMERDGQRERVTTYYGHPLITTKRTDAKGTLNLVYAKPLDDLNRLPEVRVWKSDVALKVGSRTASRGTMTVLYLGEQVEEVGDCEYDVWMAQTKLELEGASTNAFNMRFSPELGLVLRATRLDEKNYPVSYVGYDEIIEGGVE